jgi:hypothetical protein
MNRAEYVEKYKDSILEAAKSAYARFGRGAMVVYPQQDQSGTFTEANWHLLAELQEDEDPAVKPAAKYNPEIEAILLVVMDEPQGIYTYRLTGTTIIELAV